MDTAARLASIRASNIFRLTELYRRIVPRPVPPRAEAEGHAFTAPAPEPADERDPLEQMIERERAELARLEAEFRRLHHALSLAKQSRLRRAWMAARENVRRAIGAARHPLWTIGAGARVVGNRGALAGVRVAWRRLCWNTSLFRGRPPVEQQTDQANAADAIRWLPPVRISGETYNALLSHPRSMLTYQMQASPGSRLVAACGLLPTAWADNRGGVEFELHVEVPGRQWQARRTLTMNPGARWVDRRWRHLTIRMPAGPTCNAVVRLTTRRPDGVAGAHASSVWGEPRIEWRRTPAEMWRSVLGLVARLRYAGLLGTLRQLRELQASDGQASRYRQWVEMHTPTAEALAQMATEEKAFAYRPRISVLTPVYNTDPRWLRAAIESVRRQAYSNWELCLVDDGSTAKATLGLLQEYEGDRRIRVVHLPVNSGISAATNAALEAATGDFLAMLDHDDELAPEALHEMVRFLDRVPDADMIYSDEDKLDAAGERCDPYFKPDWSPEHFRSCMYTCHLMVLRASLVRELGGFRLGVEGSQDYDLVLRIMERTSRIHHLPQVLYHWRKIQGSFAQSGLAKTWAANAGERALHDHVERCGLDAVVLPGPAPGLYRVRHRIAGKPLVSIILPTGGRTRVVGDRTIDLLKNCVSSVVQKSTYENYEIVIGDDGELPEATAAFLESVPHKRVHFPPSGPFNYGRKLNFIVSHSRGSHLLLFNDDTEIITPEWLEAMLEYSQQEAIGVVGAKLLYPDGRIQHIGVLMGVCGMAAHAFHSHPGSTAGYGSSALIVRNYSAVTAACMMTRRDLYERLGGFDGRFIFDFNDTDYCLRLRREGYRIVYTPYAELYHFEMATYGARPWHADEIDYMRRTWAEVCEHDPYYNPHLTRDFPDYRVRV